MKKVLPDCKTTLSVLFLSLTVLGYAQNSEKNRVLVSESDLNDGHSSLHKRAVELFLSPDFLRDYFYNYAQKIGISKENYEGFIEFLKPVSEDFNREILTLHHNPSFIDITQLDSLFKAYESFFVSQKERFLRGLNPELPEYLNNSAAGAEFKNQSSTFPPSIPLIPNGPCVNMDFTNGLTGWTGSYGTSTTSTNIQVKRCNGFLVSYNYSTDQCCPLIGSCRPWDPVSDGYTTQSVSINNPNQNNGFNTAANNTPANAAGANGVHVIMTGGFDPIIPGNALSVVPPGGGNSIRLGWGRTGYNAQAIRQTFLVTNDNKNFVYHFAAVLNDPETGHESYELPYLRIRMYDQNNNSIQCAALDVTTADAGTVGGFIKVPNQPIFWKNWTSVTVPLNAYMGQNVTIEFVTSNCSQSGHYGYGYFSAECRRQEIIASSPAICGGSTITLTAPPGLASYNWTGPGIISGQNTSTITVGTPGNYSVTMTTVTTPPFVPCTFTIDTVIGGNPSRPFANFSAPSGCYGSPIQFTDLSTPTNQITAWEWYFDNNNSIDATTQNPTYIFPAPGVYPVRLRVTWPPCMADTTINVTINPKPTVNFTAPPVCQGTATQFTNATNLNGATNPTYTWNFGDPPSGVNNTSNQNNPSHLFTTSGSFDVNLTVNTPNCTSDTTITVNVNGRPRAQFDANEVCFGNTTTFTDNSTTGGSPLNTWVWIFSDPNNTNNTSSDQNPTHTYTGAGTFPVTLVVTNANNCSKDTTINVTVNALPVANFAFKTFCEGLTLNTAGNFITNGSLIGDGTVNAPSSITGYSWDLDNNGTFESNGQTVNVSQANFPTAGQYPVSLIVTTDKGCRDTVTGDFVVLPNPIVDAGDVQAVCNGQCVNLNGTTNSLSYQWSPVNGLSDPLQLNSQACPNATTLYALQVMDGYTYPVFNTADTVICFNFDTVSVIVKPLPVANFSAPPVCQMFSTDFTDQSTLQGGNITGWSWNFGEPASGPNNTSTLQSPSHTYLASGTYNVNLQVQGSNNCSKDTTIQVVVHPKPVPDFTFTNACADSANTFDASLSTVSLGAITTYQWDVNNSIVSFEYTGQTALHLQGTAGTYDVTLVATTDNGCKDTITKTVNVWPEPIADFNYTIVCANTATSLTSASTVGAPDNIIEWTWDFNTDGTVDANGENVTNTFTTGGNKTVELNVKTNHGCTDKITKQVYVNYNPVPDFTVTNRCYYDALSFSSTSTVTGPATITAFAWDFGAGLTGTGANPTNTYPTCGNYNVQLTVTTDSGCTSSITKPAQAYCKPVAQFTKNDICTYQTAQFNGSASNVSDGTISTYQWDFNLNVPANTFDNQSASVQPTTNYPPGIYPVGLIVTSNFGCKDTVTDTIRVYQKPVAAFTPDAVCFGSPSSFSDNSTINAPETIVSWAWDFMNDGSVDNNTQNPTFIFPNDGSIPVKLVITSNYGCRDTLVKPVMVNSIPVPNFTAPNVCLNNVTSFTNTSSINLGTIASFSWTFGNGQSSSQTSPSILYANENQYNVCLYATSDQQCRDSVCKNVTVYPLPNANFIGLPLTGCEPLVTTFNNLSTVSSVNPNSNDQIATYSWSFGDGGTKISNNGNAVTNTYSAGTYSVSLFVTTNNGCKADTTFYNYVTAYPLPKANFSFNPQPTTILKPVINFLDLSIGGDTVWWDLGDGTKTLVVDAIGDGFYHEYKDSGKYVVTQIVKTEWGCIDSIKKVIYIGPDWALYVPNAFTPNGDGINDYFMAKGFGIIEFEMRIYDRWGNFIGRISDFNDKGWNGKVQDFSEEAQIDVYVYRINFKDVFSKPHQLTGTFTLVR